MKLAILDLPNVVTSASIELQQKHISNQLKVFSFHIFCANHFYSKDFDEVHVFTNDKLRYFNQYLEKQTYLYPFELHFSGKIDVDAELQNYLYTLSNSEIELNEVYKNSKDEIGMYHKFHIAKWMVK